MPPVRLSGKVVKKSKSSLVIPKVKPDFHVQSVSSVQPGRKEIEENIKPFYYAPGQQYGEDTYNFRDRWLIASKRRQVEETRAGIKGVAREVSSRNKIPQWYYTKMGIVEPKHQNVEYANMNADLNTDVAEARRFQDIAKELHIGQSVDAIKDQRRQDKRAYIRRKMDAWAAANPNAGPPLAAAQRAAVEDKADRKYPDFTPTDLQTITDRETKLAQKNYPQPPMFRTTTEPRSNEERVKERSDREAYNKYIVDRIEAVVNAEHRNWMNANRHLFASPAARRQAWDAYKRGEVERIRKTKQAGQREYQHQTELDPDLYRAQVASAEALGELGHYATDVGTELLTGWLAENVLGTSYHNNQYFRTGRDNYLPSTFGLGLKKCY
jgi:hypothetical protein